MAEKGVMSSDEPAASEVLRPERRTRRRLTRLVRLLILLLILAVALPLALVPLYAVVNPPASALMVMNRLAGVPINQQWVSLDEISPHLVRAVLMSEDSRFCSHHGVDWREVRQVVAEIEDGRRPRGASTITMQTVKNLFLWPGRSWVRKSLEVPLALYADLVLSKRRIMEIYLNVAEWDTGVYGAEAAARRYFNVPARYISAAQAARLAATLPEPGVRNPASPGPLTRAVANVIAQRAARSGAYVRCVLGEDVPRAMYRAKPLARAGDSRYMARDRSPARRARAGPARRQTFHGA
jgi:monofunctional glycosyltransferase